jgi:hypothetical protein
MPYSVNFNEEKTVEAASLFLKAHQGNMKYLLLVKLLYFLDRESFKRWERPVTYDSYASLPYGPVVSTTLDIIKGRNPDAKIWNSYIQTEQDYEVSLIGEAPKIKKLSPAEIGLISELDAKFGRYDPFVLAQKMHDLPEYHDPNGSSLPIRTEDLLIAVGYSSEDISRILTEIQEEAKIDLVFS